MPVEPNFSQLTPYLQDALGYVATAAAGRLIGNRADAWFMSLFYHQRKRLIDWLSAWSPELDDIKKLAEDDNLKMLFSSIVYSVSNEINDVKILLWPEVTDSIIRRKDLQTDKKQYFVSLFNRSDSFFLKYLATLYIRQEIDYFEVFNEVGEQPDLNSDKHTFYLGQLQCATTGMTEVTRGVQPIKFHLTQLGKEFVDFISDHSKERLKAVIQ